MRTSTTLSELLFLSLTLPYLILLFFHYSGQDRYLEVMVVHVSEPVESSALVLTRVVHPYSPGPRVLCFKGELVCVSKPELPPPLLSGEPG
jgi:hypothetical protein